MTAERCKPEDLPDGVKCLGISLEGKHLHIRPVEDKPADADIFAALFAEEKKR